MGKLSLRFFPNCGKQLGFICLVVELASTTTLIVGCNQIQPSPSLEIPTVAYTRPLDTAGGVVNEPLTHEGESPSVVPASTAVAGSVDTAMSASSPAATPAPATMEPDRPKISLAAAAPLEKATAVTVAVPPRDSDRYVKHFRAKRVPVWSFPQQAGAAPQILSTDDFVTEPTPEGARVLVYQEGPQFVVLVSRSLGPRRVRISDVMLSPKDCADIEMMPNAGSVPGAVSAGVGGSLVSCKHK